jgi:hypothetical protein
MEQPRRGQRLMRCCKIRFCRAKAKLPLGEAYHCSTDKASSCFHMSDSWGKAVKKARPRHGKKLGDGLAFQVFWRKLFPVSDSAFV